MEDECGDRAGRPRVVLDRQAYTTEFYGVYREMEVLWKVERAQHLREPYSPSWVAWPTATGTGHEAHRGVGREFAADVVDSVELRRLRIAERPLSAYLQWEFQVLRARAGVGERTRVLDVSRCGHPGAPRTAPEILILSRELMYEVLYDDIGAHIGGRRIIQKDVIATCLSDVESLYDRAEDLNRWLAATPISSSFRPFVSFTMNTTNRYDSGGEHGVEEVGERQVPVRQRRERHGDHPVGQPLRRRRAPTGPPP